MGYLENLPNKSLSNPNNTHAIVNEDFAVLLWNLKDGSFLASAQWEKYMLSSFPSKELLDPEICCKGIHPDDIGRFSDFCKRCRKEFCAVVLLHLLLKNNETQLVLVSAAVATNNSTDFIVVKIFDIKKESKRSHFTSYIEQIVDAGNGIIIHEEKDGNPKILYTNDPIELQIALAVRDADTINAVFLAAYDLESDEMFHFFGELLPDEIRNKEKFSEIKTYYLEYVHEKDTKKIVYNEIRLYNARTNNSRKEEITLECRIIQPSSITKDYIWVEITFIIILTESGRRICCVLAKDITSQKKEREALLHSAKLDPYSCILPRMTFEEFCASQRTNRVIERWLNAVLLIDFDFEMGDSIKGIGHIDILNRISKKTEPVITSHIDEKNYAARFSDTMFLMSMHELPSINALREQVFCLHDELIKSLSNENMTVCIGVALCHHDKEIGFRCVYDDAEQALFIAKKSGKSKVVFYKLDSNEDLDSQTNSVFIRTFSNFEIFVNDTPINFRNKKAKELLAILVDRRGGFVSNTEAAGLLWEDEAINKQVRSRFRKVAMHLNNTLEEYGIKNIIEIDGRSRRLCTDKVTCDLYNYLSHKEKYAETYGGFYLNEFSWAEITTAELNREIFVE